MQDDDETLDSASQSAVRDENGRLLPGHKMGRPKGSKNKLALSTMARIKDMTPAALEQLEQQLSAGNWDACRWILERVVGKNRLVELNGDKPSDISDALVNGEISTSEGKEIASVIESLRKVEEIDSVIKRMDELERLLKG